MKTLRTYNSMIQSDINQVCPAVKGIIGYLSEVYGSIDDCCLFELKVVLNELILNAIKHGNRGNADKQVKIVAGLAEADHVFIIVENEGEGFDYQCVMQNMSEPGSLVDICDIKETGRGIMIVNNLCDRVKINKKGNKIIAVKRLYRN